MARAESTRKRVILGAGVIVAVACLVVLDRLGRRHEPLGPHRGMPHRREERGVLTLMERIREKLTEVNPKLAAALNPGLTDDEIKKFEQQVGYELPQDVIALYKWRNGMRPYNPKDPIEDCLFPGFRFVSMSEAFQVRDVRGDESLPAYARRLARWPGELLPIFVDLCGDSYVVYLGRGERYGEVFLRVHDDVDGPYYANLRDLLGAILHCYENGMYFMGKSPHPQRPEILTSDFDKEYEILQQFARE